MVVNSAEKTGGARRLLRAAFFPVSRFVPEGWRTAPGKWSLSQEGKERV